MTKGTSALESAKVRRRFSRDEGGVAAIEFAMLAMPFFGLLFSILELGMVFFADMHLEKGVSDASRRLRTGQNVSSAEFRAALCDGEQRAIRGIVKCNADLVTTVETLTGFGAAPAGTAYSGGGSRIVVATATYRYRATVPLFGLVSSTESGWDWTMVATSVFCTEPFDGGNETC